MHEKISIQSKSLKVEKKKLELPTKRKLVNPSKKETTNIFENNPWMKKMSIEIIRYYEKNDNET